MISNDSKPPISLVKLAHNLINGKVKSGDIVIDATVGNGHDTRFLLDLVKPKGNVFGFDIQQSAIESARSALQGHSFTECLALIQASHANMSELIPLAYHGKISAVMFNLGYLPGGDKRIITKSDSTLAALASASQLLSADGIITILAYPGHEGGEMETDQVKNWCLGLDPGQYQVRQFENHPDNPSAPKLFVVSKMG
ncbi:class I SAM-dependent methyltransferase [Methyloglobulus sp.]|uniref:class I SAM-dependent methyltransferase n=1 Tax=Methyloglobulus sp. TaxID=2518622 RepID=UPI0032B8732C